MLVSEALIRSSQTRLRFDPKKVAIQIGESDRGRWMTDAQKRQRLVNLYSVTGSPERARRALERIIGGNDLVGINFLTNGINASKSVCRVQIRSGSGDPIGYGTGFLVGPGVMMTNHHVLGRSSDAVNSIADFDYEIDETGRERVMVSFELDPQRLFYSNEKLDFCIVAVRERSIEGGRNLLDWGWLPLNSSGRKSDIGEYLTIIQHPEGERKQVCVRENKLLRYTGHTLWYQTDTLGGSSGSPVFNRFWQVVAIHHSGVPRKDKNGNWLTISGGKWDPSMDESKVDWIANEGIRISSIATHIRDSMGNNPLVKSMFESRPTGPERLGRDVGNSRQSPDGSVWVESDGATSSLVVPIRVPISVIRRDKLIPGSGDRVAPALMHSQIGSNADDGVIEKVEIDQSTLDKRPGYQADFLGKGKFTVPLPVLSKDQKTNAVTLKGGSKKVELKYFNYSVVMNRSRKLAYFTAVNIDGALRQDVGKREGDRWYKDPRIDARYQIGDEFYKRQAADEARTKNPFDRGHLVRRLDATWGGTVDEAKEHGNDTFHFTNCSPQFYKFNQGKKLWLGIEEYVLDNLEEGERKACVFNGPIFDGPIASDGNLPDTNSAYKKDPVFKGIHIPKYFWKLMVVREEQGLSATAFLLSQQEQILGIDRIREAGVIEKLTQAEARVFQVSIADLARLTKLNFGALAKRDTLEKLRVKPKMITSLEQIQI